MARSGPGWSRRATAKALQGNHSGSNNVATGYQALRGTSGDTGTGTGHDNVATGTEALYSNRAGHDNVAAGTHALRNSVAASYNVAVGSESLLANTTGIRNVALSPYALRENTTGLDNVATGYQALRANKTGRERLIAEDVVRVLPALAEFDDQGQGGPPQIAERRMRVANRDVQTTQRAPMANEDQTNPGRREARRAAKRGERRAAKRAERKAAKRVQAARTGDSPETRTEPGSGNS